MHPLQRSASSTLLPHCCRGYPCNLLIYYLLLPLLLVQFFNLLPRCRGYLCSYLACYYLQVLLLLKKKYCLLEKGPSQLGSAISEYSLYTSDLELSPTHSQDLANTDEEDERQDEVALSQLAGEGSAEREVEDEHGTATSGAIATDVSPSAQLQDAHAQEMKQNHYDYQQTSTPVSTPISAKCVNTPAAPSDRETPQSIPSVQESSGGTHSSLQNTPDQNTQGDVPEPVFPEQLPFKEISADGSSPKTLIYDTASPEAKMNEQNLPPFKVHLPDEDLMDGGLTTDDNTTKPADTHICQEMLPLKSGNVEYQRVLPSMSHNPEQQTRGQAPSRLSPDALPPSPKDGSPVHNLTPLGGTPSNSSEEGSDSQILVSQSHSILQVTGHHHSQTDAIRRGSQSCPPIDLLEEESAVSLTTPCLSRPPSPCKNPRGLAYPSSQFGPVLSAAESVSFSCTSVSTGLPSSVASEKQ